MGESSVVWEESFRQDGPAAEGVRCQRDGNRQHLQQLVWSCRQLSSEQSRLLPSAPQAPVRRRPCWSKRTRLRHLHDSQWCNNRLELLPRLQEHSWTWTCLDPHVAFSPQNPDHARHQHGGQSNVCLSGEAWIHPRTVGWSKRRELQAQSPCLIPISWP